LAFRVQPATGCCLGGQNLGQCAPKQGSLTQTETAAGNEKCLRFFPWNPWKIMKQLCLQALQKSRLRHVEYDRGVAPSAWFWPPLW
jgi:hypothetical protein